jgi:hypothetical protein
MNTEERIKKAVDAYNNGQLNMDIVKEEFKNTKNIDAATYNTYSTIIAVDRGIQRSKKAKATRQRKLNEKLVKTGLFKLD